MEIICVRNSSYILVWKLQIFYYYYYFIFLYSCHIFFMSWAKYNEQGTKTMNGLDLFKHIIARRDTLWMRIMCLYIYK